MLTIPDTRTIQRCLLEQLGRIPDQLAPTVLESFVAGFFARKNEFLGLLHEQPSPLYVFEPGVLRQRAGQFRAAFAGSLPECAFFYAVKSNNYPGMARTVLEEGFGLDVSSGQELALALELGAREIVFSGPAKTKAELHLAVRNRERVAVLLDSVTEMTRLQEIAAGAEQRIRVGVRLCTQPGGLWRKFGILPEELPAFCMAIRSCPWLDLQGLQFHTSWNLTPKAQVDFLAELGRILAGMPAEDRAVLRFVDIGGGYWPEAGEWLQEGATEPGRVLNAIGLEMAGPPGHYHLPAQPLAIFARELGAAIRRHLFPHLNCRICFEPGRWLCHDAMHLLLTVLDIKGAAMAITDGGANAVGWERFENDYFPVLNLSRPELRERACTIVGSLCTPHDLWGYHYWGADIRPNDVLLIPAQGAYTYSLRQHFIKPLPEVAWLEPGTQQQGATP